MTQFPETDPADLFRARDGLYASELLAAAVLGLDFFSWLEKSPADAKQICDSLGLAARPVDVMLSLFCAMRLIENRSGVFHPTKKAREFLISGSPWFLGPFYSSFLDRPVYQTLLGVLRGSKGAVSARQRTPWAQAMEDDTYAQEFTRTMDARGIFLGPVLARLLEMKDYRHLMDIGGGSGIYACCIVAAHPHMQATVFEKSPVDRVARQCIARRGYAERVEVVTGDMFEDPLPEGRDVHLWSNALHDWDTPAVKALLGKSFAALPPGGMVVIHDGHLNREKDGPLTVAAYSAFLMSSTDGRCYSVGEIEGILTEVGFERVNFQTTAVDHSAITARKPLSHVSDVRRA